MPLIVIVLVGVAVCAWGYLLYSYVQMKTLPMDAMWMAPASPRPWTLEDFSVVYTMWAVMMAAMMLPTALPMVKAYDKASLMRQRGDLSHSLLFTFAYLLIWFFFSIALTLLQWRMHGLNWLTPMMANNNAYMAGTILFMAGAYQFSNLKNHCLSHCRSPVGFLLNHWQPGRLGGFLMGLRHGSHCLGCCWAQMLVMFAVGVMNIGGMIALTLFMLLEKNLPRWTRTIGRTTGLLLCFWGLGLIVL